MMGFSQSSSSRPLLGEERELLDENNPSLLIHRIANVQRGVSPLVDLQLKVAQVETRITPHDRVRGQLVIDGLQGGDGIPPSCPAWQLELPRPSVACAGPLGSNQLYRERRGYPASSIPRERRSLSISAMISLQRQTVAIHIGDVLRRDVDRFSQQRVERLQILIALGRDRRLVAHFLPAASRRVCNSLAWAPRRSTSARQVVALGVHVFQSRRRKNNADGTPLPSHRCKGLSPFDSNGCCMIAPFVVVDRIRVSGLTDTHDAASAARW